MLHHLSVNVNPLGRRTGDCSTRAIASCLGIGWKEALGLQFQESLRSGYSVDSHEVVEAVLAEAGWVRQPQPRRGSGPHAKKYKVREMDEVCSPDELRFGVIVDVAHHYVCLKGSQYVDTWDSGCKTVGNWFRFAKGASR